MERASLLYKIPTHLLIEISASPFEVRKKMTFFSSFYLIYKETVGNNVNHLLEMRRFSDKCWFLAVVPNTKKQTQIRLDCKIQSRLPVNLFLDNLAFPPLWCTACAVGFSYLQNKIWWAGLNKAINFPFSDVFEVVLRSVIDGPPTRMVMERSDPKDVRGW